MKRKHYISLFVSLFLILNLTCKAEEKNILPDENPLNEKLSLLPEAINVSIGDLKIQIQKKSFWNLSSIYYKGNCAATPAGWYGTVLGYNKTGWVGSGHMENKIGEKIEALEFYVNGKKALFEELKKQPDIQCESFELNKTSILLDVKLNYKMKLADNILAEESRLAIIRKCSIGVVYNFMHCWNNDFTDYLLAGAEVQTGSFTGDDGDKSFIMEKPRYGILFNRNAKYGIVSVVDKTFSEKTFFRLWSRVPAYRKLYLGMHGRNFEMSGEESFAMKTSFFQALSGNWRKEAETLAKKLNETGK